jgi:hypothetical protein
MARNYLINLQGVVSASPVSLWLTSDGTDDGRPCRTKIPGVALLLAAATATGTIGDDGIPFNEYPVTAGGGRAFDILIPSLPTARWTEIKNLIDAMQIDKSEGTFIGTNGEPGAFDVNWIPRPDPIPLDCDGFSIGYVRNVIIRGITTAIN